MIEAIKFHPDANGGSVVLGKSIDLEVNMITWVLKLQRLVAWTSPSHEGWAYQLSEGSRRWIGNGIDRHPALGIGKVVVENETRVFANGHLMGCQSFVKELGGINELRGVCSAFADEGVGGLPREGRTRLEDLRYLNGGPATSTLPLKT